MSYLKMFSRFCFCCSIASIPLIVSENFSPRAVANHDAEEIDRLVKQLGSDSFREREAAMESLRRIGRTTLPALLKAQNSTDPEIRRRAKKLVDQIDVDLKSLLKRHAAIRYYKNQKPSYVSVREIDLPGGEFSDSDLILVREFVNLRWLDLSCARITNAGLEQIENLTNLERLDINDTSVSKIGSLDGLKKLTYLSLDSLKITDKELEHIKNLPNLETIGLSGTNITDAGLAHLKHLKKLRQLHLGNSKITDKGLAYLAANFKELTYLNLAGAQISDAGLVHLKELKKLKHLVYHRAKVTAKGIADLRKALPNLDP